MLSRWPIRSKLLLCLGLLFLIVTGLSFGSFRGVYSYRRLARSLSQRARELPLSANLTQSINQLKAVVGTSMETSSLPITDPQQQQQIEDSFRHQHHVATLALQAYRARSCMSLQNVEPLQTFF